MVVRWEGFGGVGGVHEKRGKREKRGRDKVKLELQPDLISNN